MLLIFAGVLGALALPATLKKEVRCTMCGKTMEVSLFSNEEKNFCVGRLRSFIFNCLQSWR